MYWLTVFDWDQHAIWLADQEEEEPTEEPADYFPRIHEDWD